IFQAEDCIRDRNVTGVQTCALPIYRCKECSHVWRQDTTAAAPPRAKISRAGLRWGLVGIVVGHLSMARVAEGLGVAWNTANDAEIGRASCRDRVGSVGLVGRMSGGE